MIEYLVIVYILIMHSIVFIHYCFSKVFRTEGVWPVRNGNEIFKYYRSHVNPEPFKDYGGLVTE